MKPTRTQELAVLRSVVYASLFDYPLTLAQLRATLVEVSADEATLRVTVAYTLQGDETPRMASFERGGTA